MLNYLWGYMILIGLGYGIATGQVEALSNAAIDSAGEAVTLAVTMLGIMSMWTGLMEVAKQAGIMDKMTRALHPAVQFLFPRIPQDHPVRQYITANIVANVLGLGWAATPMGLKTMEGLAQLERDRLAAEELGISLTHFWQERETPGYRSRSDEKQLKNASDEMCTFLVINISSLQLIPVSVIAYRAQYGAVNPAAVVMPGLIATLVSTLVAVVFCRMMCRKGER